MTIRGTVFVVSSVLISLLCVASAQQYGYGQPTPSLQPLMQPLTQPSIRFLRCPLFQFQHAVVPIASGSSEFKIQFNALANVDVALVDVHWRIVRAGGVQELDVNERMTKLSATNFERYVQSFPIRLNPGDCVHYWFTYCAVIDGVRIDCDTDKFVSCYQPTPVPQALTAPQQQLGCPLFPIQHSVVATAQGSSEYKIQFSAQTSFDVTLVDVHWRVIRASGSHDIEVNERMTKLSGTSFERNVPLSSIRLNVGDCIHYWFTYCLLVNNVRIDCDTDKFSSCPQPQQQAIRQLQPSYGFQEPTQQLQLPQGYQTQFAPQSMIAATIQQQQFQCPLFQIQHAVVPVPATDQWKIQFTAMTTSDVALVDVHWHIQRATGAPEPIMNERMTKLTGTTFERAATSFPIRMNAGDCLHYWFTYCVATSAGRVDCDTERFTNCVNPGAPQKSLF